MREERQETGRKREKSQESKKRNEKQKEREKRKEKTEKRKEKRNRWKRIKDFDSELNGRGKWKDLALPAGYVWKDFLTGSTSFLLFLFIAFFIFS